MLIWQFQASAPTLGKQTALAVPSDFTVKPRDIIRLKRIIVKENDTATVSDRCRFFVPQNDTCATAKYPLPLVANNKVIVADNYISE